MPQNENKLQIPEDVQKEIMQIFIDVPGLTSAKGQYRAEIVRRADNRLAIKFGVKQGASEDVPQILGTYISSISNYNIAGVDIDKSTGHLIIDDTVTLATVMNAYLEDNPHQLSEDIPEGVGNQIATLITSIAKNQTSESSEEEKNIVRGLDMQRQFFALMSQIPDYVLGIKDYTVHGQVNPNGSIEIGFEFKHVKEPQKESLGIFTNCLDAACAQDPNRFGYDVETNRYLFATAQELYDFMGNYLSSLVPEEAYQDPRKRTTRIQKVLACKETLESIFDDFVPSMDISQEIQSFSKPRSVQAIALALRTFLNNYSDTSAEDTESFYINCEEQEGEFIFTISCSNFSSEEHPDEKLEIMEELFSALDLYRPEGVFLEFNDSIDNISICTHDLRRLLKLFKPFCEEHGIGGPEDVESIAVDRYGMIDIDATRKHIEKMAANFDEAAEVSQVFELVPMRPYASLEALKTAYLIQNNAPALISYHGLEAAILEEYHGARSIHLLSLSKREQILH